MITTSELFNTTFELVNTTSELVNILSELVNIRCATAVGAEEEAALAAAIEAAQVFHSTCVNIPVNIPAITVNIRAIIVDVPAINWWQYHLKWSVQPLIW